MYSFCFSVKCSQKTVKDAYYIICKPCSLQLEICCKCGKKEEIVIPWVVLYVSFGLFEHMHAFRGLVIIWVFLCFPTLSELTTSLLTILKNKISVTFPLPTFPSAIHITCCHTFYINTLRNVVTCGLYLYILRSRQSPIQTHPVNCDASLPSCGQNDTSQLTFWKGFTTPWHALLPHCHSAFLHQFILMYCFIFYFGSIIAISMCTERKITFFLNVIPQI